jgi:antirestriction protein ArdC
MNETRTDIYTKITNRILADLEQGVRPWLKPWNSDHAAGRITRPLRHNGIPYSGINVLVLWSEAVDKGYSSPLWMTYKQSQELGGQVRKGEHGTQVVYADKIVKTETDAAGKESERAIPFLKAFTVFSTEQIDGLPAHYYARAEPPKNDMHPIEHAEAFFKNVGSTVRIGGGKAFYSPSLDLIQMPLFESFRDAESWTAVLAHEHIHYTKHETRLNRDLGRKRYGDEGTAREELVAELGSAFLCADLNLTPEVREDHSSYIASWIKVLQNDKRAIFEAASHAQKAADFLHKLQPQPEPAPTRPNDTAAPDLEGLSP